MEGRRLRAKQTNVQVHCSNDHDTTLGIEDVAIVHANGTVVGYRFKCPTCSTVNDVVASADTLAVLHAFGVTSLESSAEPPPTSVGEQREVVSLRVLLDHPETVSALFAAPAADQPPRVEQESGSPSP